MPSPVEGFPSDAEGRPLNTTLRSLAIVRPKDMPPVDVKLVEVPQPDSPYGIKGVGEIGLVPTAGAVAAALADFDGIWRRELPMRNDSNRERPWGTNGNGSAGNGSAAGAETPTQPATV